MKSLLVAALVAAAAAGATPAAAVELSVLTYNVEGLPFPARVGRGADLARIGNDLRDMRAAGTQPRVVVFQEAFSPAAKAIARRAGYRYIAEGPGADVAGSTDASPGERSFAAAGSVFKGEHLGKWVGSGLLIASDFPIVAAQGMPYPAYACAGYDCLANKGVLLVRLRVPGAATPVVLAATHLNSCAASRVPFTRSLVAYRAQVDALGGFLRRNLDGADPVIVAGDFNVGDRAARRSYLLDSANGWSPAAVPQAALASCGATCARADRADLGWATRRARDWQFYVPGRRATLDLVGLSAPFGHAADGSMLSDHVGYVARYRLVDRSGPPAVIAARTPAGATRQRAI